MSEEQLKAFLEKVQDDTNLQEKLKVAASSDAVVVIAKDAGFEISAENLKGVFGPPEVSDGELEGVAGGTDLTDVRQTCPQINTFDAGCKVISNALCTKVLCF